MYVFRFDGLLYHYMGQCSYYYVTTCNDDKSVDSGIPFEVTGEHYECYEQIEGRTCMKSTWVRFYNSDGEVAVIVRLGEDFSGMFDFLLFSCFVFFSFFCICKQYERKSVL